MLDAYQVEYLKNMEYLKRQTQALLEYEKSLKYYANENNMKLKVVNENRKKTEWLTKAKKSI